MRSVNKIRERDMDPEFLLSLLNNSQSLNITELLNSYVRKDETIPVSALASDYVESVENNLQDLRSSISDIEEQYRKTDTLISMKDFDSEINDILSAILYFLKHIKTQGDAVPIISTTNEGDRIIVITDNTGNEHNVIIPFMYDTDSSFSVIDKQRFDSQLATLQSQVNNLASAVYTLKQVLGLNNTESSAGYSGSLTGDINVSQIMTTLSEQSDRISQLENRLAALQSNNDNVSLDDIMNKLKEHDNAVLTLQEKSAKKVQYTGLSPELQQTVDNMSDFARRLSLVENNKMNVPVLDKNGYLFYSVEEGNTVKSRPPILKASVCDDVDDIVVAQNNNEDFIINLQTGEGYQFNSISRSYDTFRFEKNPEFEYMLILNTQTEAIEYFVFEGTLVKLNNVINGTQNINKSGVTIKRVTMAANSSYRLERFNNLKKTSPTVLVHDTEDNSRSIDKYINSEAVITVSHDNNGFTLYNDSVHELEVLIVAGD